MYRRRKRRLQIDQRRGPFSGGFLSASNGGILGKGEDHSCPSRLQRDEGWRDGEMKKREVWLEDDYVRAVEAEEES